MLLPSLALDSCMYHFVGKTTYWMVTQTTLRVNPEKHEGVAPLEIYFQPLQIEQRMNGLYSCMRHVS